MKEERFRDISKQLTKKKSISQQELDVRYASERFLKRVAKSEYHSHFIIKGGFIQGHYYAIEQRTTRDLDTLIRDYDARKSQVESMLIEIMQVALDDGVAFELKALEDSQVERQYQGFRAKIIMSFVEGKRIIPLDIDIGVGDVVTPEPVLLEILLLFQEEKGANDTISVNAYPRETILAEKLEIILDMGTQTTRMKDFYDVYCLLIDSHLENEKLCFTALQNTWNYRHPDKCLDTEVGEDWQFQLNDIATDKKLKEYWVNYTRSRDYAKNVTFETIVQCIQSHIEKMLCYVK